MRIRNLFTPLGIAIALAASSPANAQSPDRLVVVNGAVMNDTELLVLDTLNCGVPVPNGRYWLNTNTGAWGFQGGPRQGIIGAACRQATYSTPGQPANHGGTWEDRMIGNGTRNWGETPIIVNPVYQ